MKLQSIRSLFLLLLGVLSLTAAHAQEEVIDKIVARVNNEIILKSELDVNYLQILSQNDDYSGSSEDLRCKVLEQMVINKMLLAKAKIDSVTVEEEQVQAQIQQRMAYFANMAGGESQLEEHYGKTIAELKEDLRKSVWEQMVSQKMQQRISSKVKATPSDIREFFNEIPADSLPFFNSQLEISQIVVKPKVSEKVKRETREQLKEIRQQIKDGADFCEMVQQYSQDPASKSNCGNIGFFKRGQLVPEFEAAALRLRPGEMSRVVETEYGFHIIQLVDRRGNEFSTRHLLLRPEPSTDDHERARVYLDSIRTLILNDEISFDKAAKSYSEDKETSVTGGRLRNEETGSFKVSAETLDPDLYFIVDTLNVGDITTPVEYSSEEGEKRYRIIYLKNKVPPHTANLKDDYQEIANATRSQKREKALMDWFNKTKNELFIEIDPDYKYCNLLITQ